MAIFFKNYFFKFCHNSCFLDVFKRLKVTKILKTKTYLRIVDDLMFKIPNGKYKAIKTDEIIYNSPLRYRSHSNVTRSITIEHWSLLKAN